MSNKTPKRSSSKDRSNLPKPVDKESNEELDELLSEVPEEAKPILKRLPAKDAEIIVTTIMKASLFSGPIPHPEILQGYEKVLPGSADRILKMAESQSQHRQALESKLVASQTSLNARGQIFAFILALICLGLSYVFVTMGFTTVAIALLTTTILGLAAVFITSKRGSNKDTEKK